MDDKIDLPFHWADIKRNPCWIKLWIDGFMYPVMIYVNHVYVDLYGKEMLTYPGSSDMEKWGEEVGKMFSGGDLHAVGVSPRPVTLQEYVPTKGVVPSRFEKVIKQAHRVDAVKSYFITGELFIDDDATNNRKHRDNNHDSDDGGSHRRANSRMDMDAA